MLPMPAPPLASHFVASIVSAISSRLRRARPIAVAVFREIITPYFADTPCLLLIIIIDY
jgi:hypothetical protein